MTESLTERARRLCSSDWHKSSNGTTTHDMLSELCRVADQRIIFQHWFMPTNADGQYKKLHAFELRDVYVWQPKTYFGRVQVISVLDRA